MPDLSPHLHTEECNKLITLLTDCYSENKFKKFLGTCNQFQVVVDKCLKNERLDNQAKNLEEARKRKKAIIELMSRPAL